jgi:ATP-dependent Clp protease ATP-binding subunit ClpA
MRCVTWRQGVVEMMTDCFIGCLVSARVKKELETVRGTSKKVENATGDTNFQALKKYGRDLVEDAVKLDVIGRDDEIRRVVRILSRRTKNNPVLIGEPGVGKTAVVEGLAQRIVRGDVPRYDVWLGLSIVFFHVAFINLLSIIFSVRRLSRS